MMALALFAPPAPYVPVMLFKLWIDCFGQLLINQKIFHQFLDRLIRSLSVSPKWWMFVCKHSPCVFIVAVTRFDLRAHSSVAGWDGTPQTAIKPACLIYWRTSVGVRFWIFRAWHHIYHFTPLHTPIGLQESLRISWGTSNLGDAAEIMAPVHWYMLFGTHMHIRISQFYLCNGDYVEDKLKKEVAAKSGGDQN